MPLLRLSDIHFDGNEFWRPINDQQLTAMQSEAQLLLFGGASGGGKTDLLIADAVQEYENPSLRALLIRRAFTEMPQIVDRCRAVYPHIGGKPSDGGFLWKFPSGSQVRLAYLRDNGDIGNFQGNPFSYLGVDESTYFPEHCIRNILPWHAVPDPNLFHRIRLTSNPGQIGADWHMRLFLRGHCPVHFPAESVVPTVVYEGSKWMDGVPTKLSTSFIPSLATDNPLYGQEKIDRLESQTAENAEKLLRGCWCALEGAYFKFFQPSYKLPYATCGEKWWHSHIISVDYGFGESWAAAGLYFITESTPDWPEGRMFKVGELAEQEMGSEDFAKKIGTSFIEPFLGEQRRQIEYVVFDPATDAQTGNGRSNFDIMREVLSEKYGVSCIKAAKGAGSRISNAQNLYRMLKSGPPDKRAEWKPGQLVITDAAPISFSSFQTRIHDKDHPGDVKKINGDPKDDLYDETAYGANTYFSKSEKPPDVAMHEKLKAYKEKGMDESSLAIYRGQMQRELSKPEAPVTIGRRHGTITRR